MQSAHTGNASLSRTSVYCTRYIIGMLLLLFICTLLSGAKFASALDVDADDNRYHQHDGLHTPCTFFDTVNVTDDIRFPNGSYLHDGVIIPHHLVGLYDYAYKDLVERVSVTPHYRGCICKVKPCINFCCPWGSIYNSNASRCDNRTGKHEWPAPNLNVTFGGATVTTVNIFEHFAVQSFRPCHEMFALQPEINSYDEWNLFANGSMLRTDDMLYIRKDEFCLMPTVVNDSDLYYVINPANCVYKNEYATVKIINAYAMLFSIPFMMLTIAVYLIIPELRNQHGKSLVCYLIGLAVGYSSLSSVLLISISPDGMPCKVIGYTAYYFFMSAFLWLNVISFDLWHNFRGTRGINRFHEKKRFLVYSLYSWGLALIFLVITWCAQEIIVMPANMKPGIGDGYYCWLDMHNWSAMIYFFTPVIAIILANTIMFVMTAMKIHNVQREMAKIIAREDSTKNLRTEKDRFGLFLRLFMIMGVTWSLEIFSYFVGADSSLSKVFYISDICNAMQGFLIFMLFVMKRKVKNLITNRTITFRISQNSNIIKQPETSNQLA